MFKQEIAKEAGEKDTEPAVGERSQETENREDIGSQTQTQKLARNLDQRLNSTKFLDFPVDFVDYDLTKFYKNRISIL